LSYRYLYFYPKATLALLLINFAIFVIVNVYPSSIPYLALVPFLFLYEHYYWQPLTYMFVHRQLFHFLFNMIALWSFGEAVENIIGGRGLVVLYLYSGLVSALFELSLGNFLSNWYWYSVMLGASGSIMGIVALYAILRPRSIVYLWVIPVPAIALVLLILALESFFALTNVLPQIAHLGHLGGLVAGVIPGLYLRRRYGKRVWRILGYRS